MANDRKFLTPRQVAQRYNVSESTLSTWRQRGKGPEAVKLGDRVPRYEVEAVERWANGKGRGSI